MKTFVLHACAFLARSLPAAAEIIGVEMFECSDESLTGKNSGPSGISATSPRASTTARLAHIRAIRQVC